MASDSIVQYKYNMNRIGNLKFWDSHIKNEIERVKFI
jgi:hypothetical protein